MRRLIQPVAIGSGLSLLVYLSGALVMVSPLPLLVVRLLYGRRVGITTLFFSSVFLLALAAGNHWPLVDLTYFAGYQLIAISLAESVERAQPIHRMVLIPVAIIVAGIVGVGLYFQLTGRDTIQMVTGYFNELMDTIISLRNSSQLEPNQLDFLKAHKAEIVGTALAVMPGITISLLIMLTTLNVLMARWLVRKPSLFRSVRELIYWRTPASCVWIVIGAGMLFFVSAYALQTPVLKYVAINLLIMVSALYFFHGLAIVAFWLSRSRSLALRLAIGGLAIFMFHFFAVTAVLTGFLDLWINFRRAAIKRSAPPKG